LELQLTTNKYNKNNMKLGQRARDITAGFEGVLTECAEHCTGAQYLIRQQVKEGEYADWRWVDEDRIEILENTSEFLNK
jgi:hypothetical protein